MITKLNRFFIIIISILLLIMFILKVYIDYYTNSETDNDDTIMELSIYARQNSDAIKLVSKIFILFIIGGFIYYIIDEDIISTPIANILKSDC